MSIVICISECPKRSEGTVELPSDNKLDHECSNCKSEFEVFVEFTPSYSSSEINYVKCEKCRKETRDPADRSETDGLRT